MILGASTVYKYSPAIALVVLALMVVMLKGMDHFRGRKQESPNLPSL